MRMRNREAGAAMGLVAVLAFVLVILIVAFFQLTLYFGGSKETRNAVDAGALNVGKRSFEIKVVALQPAEMQFMDVADSTGKFGLANINRVWGKALLVVANVAAMKAEGQEGSAVGNAGTTYDGARSLSDKLTDALKTPDNLHDYFKQIGGANSLRMLGAQAKLDVAAGNWDTSLTDRGRETNIEIRNSIMPSEDTYDAVAPVATMVQGKLRKWIPGYKPIAFLDHYFCLTPYRFEEKTHLISGLDFKANQMMLKPIFEYPNPVPNSFSCHGKTTDNANYGQESVSFVVVNPQRPFKLAIPHSFVHIKVEDNKVTWLLNSLSPSLGDNQVATETYENTYPSKLTPTSLSGSIGSAICGKLQGANIPLGQEYTTSTLNSALFASDSEEGSREKLEKALVQRINEMIVDADEPEFTAAKLHTLLGLQLKDGEHDYYIFAADGKTVEAADKETAKNKSQWLNNMISALADGGEKKSIELTGTAGLATPEVQVIPNEGCYAVFPPYGELTRTITCNWKPGSAYNGCLGEVTAKHHTVVKLWGIATPL